MAEYAPKAIRGMFTDIKRAIPSAQLSGIVGNPSTHTYGYHRSRDWIMRYGQGGGDYSVQQPDDKAGPGGAAAALDITLSAPLMREVTSRLNNAVNAGDDRLRALREFFGTLDGKRVYGRDVRSGRTVTADDSHLWHVHLSIYRRWADDAAALAPITEIITGDDMPSAAEIGKAVAEALLNADMIPATPPPDNNADWNTGNTEWQYRYAIGAMVAELRAQTRLTKEANQLVSELLSELRSVRAAGAAPAPDSTA